MYYNIYIKSKEETTVVLSIILGVLLLVAVCFIIILNKSLNIVADELCFNFSDKKEFLTYYFETYAKEKYPCTVFITSQEVAGDGLIYDFSRYKDKGIIGIITNTKVSGEDGWMVLPNQVVYKMEDGFYAWDARPLL